MLYPNPLAILHTEIPISSSGTAVPELSLNYHRTENVCELKSFTNFTVGA